MSLTSETKKTAAKKADNDVAEMSNTINLTGKSGAREQGPAVMTGVANVRLKGKGAKDLKGSGKRLLGYLKPYRGTLMASILMTVLSTAFAIISPRLLGNVTSQLQVSIRDKTPYNFEATIRIFIVLITLYILSWAFDSIRTYMMAGLTQKLVRDLRHQVDKKIGRLTLRYFDRNKIGDLMSKATNDIDNISTALQTSLAESITAIVTIVGVIIAMLLIDPIIALICIVTIPLGTVITMMIVRSSQKYFKRQAVFLGLINATVEESFSGHKIIKAFGREHASQAEFNDVNGKYCDAASQAQYASSYTYPLTAFVSELAFIAICLVGGLKVLSGSMLLGDVQALFQYAKGVSNPVTQVTNMMTILQTTVASAERIFSLLDEEEQATDGTEELTEPARGEVVFENVSFRYDPERPLIENFGLRVEPGRNVAIVGHTGAGKTTLVNLLMRFYEIDGGAITVDGIDIRALRRSSLRSRIGMVLQDTWLFKGSIAENIAYGAKDPGNVAMGDIVAAAKTAMADSFIKTLPDGYETVLNEETDNLSQGQKQLLTIARMVLAKPDILILDEATSSVDTRTEQLIQTAMGQLMEGRTCFIIAHRLSTIRNAQMILVMDRGKIAETGTHEELFRRGGVYSELYNSQFS